MALGRTSCYRCFTFSKNSTLTGKERGEFAVAKMALIIKAWNIHVQKLPCKSLRWQGLEEEKFPQIRKGA